MKLFQSERSEVFPEGLAPVSAPVSRPIPAPRTKKAPIPAPRTKKAPIPKGPVPVLGPLHEFLDAKLGEKQLQRNYARRYQKPNLAQLEAEVEILQGQQDFYHALRVKYAGWFLDDTVSNEDQTQTVLYNPQTGEDFLVKNEDYDLLAEFLLQRGYVNFLSADEFYQSWCHGKVHFSAGPQAETWLLLTFIKDP